MCSLCVFTIPALSLFKTCHRIFDKSNTTGVKSGVHDATLIFRVVLVAQYFVFCVLFCISLFVFLPFFSFLTARCAKWHVGQQQRYATSACPWPSSVDFPMSGLIPSFLLQRYAATLSWASLWCPEKGCLSEVLLIFSQAIFLLAFVVFVHLRLTTSDYPFWYLQAFL